MPTVTLPDGRRLGYASAGAGTPVLVLADAQQDRAALQPLLDACADGARWIAPELDMTDPGRACADAAALLNALDAAPAVVLGLGAGAGVALRLAVVQADAVHRVIADSPALAHTPEAMLGDIMCHVLLLWCKPDPAIPHQETVRIALQVPRAQRADYPAGHGAYAAHPARFLADLRGWLRKDPPPARLPMNEQRPTATRGPVVFDA